MKNRSLHLFLFVIVGLLSLSAQTTRAQQSSDNAPRNNQAEMKCRVPVTVTGAVRAPARVELRRRARLNELLAFAGGTAERATGKVEITRAALGSNCETLTSNDLNKRVEGVEVYDLAELLRGNAEANPYLQPGDTVNVSEAGVIYVMGSVPRPQQILLKESTTVTKAVEAAGGVLSDSFTNRVRIMRGCDPEMKIIIVDLKAIKKGSAADPLVQPYDIVFVPGKRAFVGMPLCRRPTPSTAELPLRVIY